MENVEKANLFAGLVHLTNVLVSVVATGDWAGGYFHGILFTGILLYFAKMCWEHFITLIP